MHESRTSDETVELRGPAPRWVIDILDAVQLSDANRWPSRMALANEILGAWAEKKVHEAQSIHRVLRRNGSPGEDDGKGMAP